MVVNSLYYGTQNLTDRQHILFTPSGVALPRETGESEGVKEGGYINADIIAQALRNIYRRDFNPTEDIEPNMFRAFAETLTQGVNTVQPELGEDPMLHALRHSADVFAAFKVHRAQNDMAARLLDSNGVLKPFEQWAKEVLPIASHQCGAWLETEYNTAVLRARQAANWRQFQREKDILPNLKWVPSTSPNPGEDHRPFWNTVLPVDHPFWDKHRPGDRWNCKCDLTSTDEPETDVQDDDGTNKDKPQRGLEDNPGKTQAVFSDSHPYFPKDCRHCDFYKPTVKARLTHFFTARAKDCFNCPYINGCIEKTTGQPDEEVIKYGEGTVRISSLINRSDSDFYKLMQVAQAFAQKGSTVRLTPKMSRPPKFQYECFYQDLIGTRFEGKCPDLNVDGAWYEHEGFISDNPKRAFRNMLNDGLKQADRLIIDKPQLTEAYMKRVVWQRIKDGQNITEIWIRDGKEVTLLYKKSEE